MTQDRTSSTDSVIDCSVHPMFSRGDEIREWMREPWRSLDFPGPARYLYPAPTGVAPFGEYLEEARSGPGVAGSDPALMSRQLSEMGVGRAVLLSLTRGLLPNQELGSAICAATNDWLAATWLGDDRYLGSIRVNPGDPEAAVREIERWADHPRMVQVAVPLEAHRPYGQRFYAAIWEAAARHRLPVAVHSDGGAGIDLYPTPNGYPRTFVEYTTLSPINFIFHLASLIVEGVFERLPDITFVFADGGHNELMPLMWRLNMGWPICRIEAPWVRSQPSTYLRGHVRFCTSRAEGPEDEAIQDEWFGFNDGAHLLLFASNYPHWSTLKPGDLYPGLAPDVRRRILSENARELYSRGIA